MDMKAIKVRELNKYIKKYVAMDYLLSNIDVEGEISNLKKHSNGNYYLTLKDDTAFIRAVIYYTDVDNLEYEPFDGDSVIASGAIAIFEKDASVTFFIRKLRSKGNGNIKEAYERLKEKLEEEGLFSKPKKKLKAFPQKVGVVTSPTGAAIQDIINVIKRRNSSIDIVLYPALVQGEGAVQSILEGLKCFEDSDVDVVIVGRGGGSYEDLVAFNDEGIARYIYSMEKTVISAVGHEIDYVISDFVADFRAPTPSSAAEIVSLSKDELRQHLDLSFNIIKNNVFEKIKSNRFNLDIEKSKLSTKSRDKINLEKVELNFSKRVLNSKLPTVYSKKTELNKVINVFDREFNRFLFENKRELSNLRGNLKLELFESKKEELRILKRYFELYRLDKLTKDKYFNLRDVNLKLNKTIYRSIESDRKKLISLDLSNKGKSLIDKINSDVKILDKSKDQLSLKVETKINRKRNLVLKIGEKLRTTKFSNMYAVDGNGKLITSIKQVKSNQVMHINFKDGVVKSKVFGIEEK